MPKKKKQRCEWPGTNQLMRQYHDEEWGEPLHDDLQLFEFLCLEGAQAGLSWQTILNKRENYRKAFDNFIPAKIAKYTDKKIAELLQDAGIVRNKLKVNAFIINAQMFLEIQEEYGSFDKFIWEFVNHKPIINSRTKLSEIPAKTEEAEAMSKKLKKLGFKFIGPTICYAFMQATGMVNDHVVSCYRYEELVG
ncbi:MAG: DNA-3-methyladenine glycosylase I [Candidatus Kariarchaeaceae archaeon]|jgi:DNA-3-methyladenine glycosylase I